MKTVHFRQIIFQNYLPQNRIIIKLQTKSILILKFICDFFLKKQNIFYKKIQQNANMMQTKNIRIYITLIFNFLIWILCCCHLLFAPNFFYIPVVYFPQLTHLEFFVQYKKIYLAWKKFPPGYQKKKFSYKMHNPQQKKISQ